MHNLNYTSTTLGVQSLRGTTSGVREQNKLNTTDLEHGQIYPSEGPMRKKKFVFAYEVGEESLVHGILISVLDRIWRQIFALQISKFYYFNDS
jgi:hypothetical protein